MQTYQHSTARPPHRAIAQGGRALRLAEKLRAGTVWVNAYRAVSFTSPFGGYKRSGLGRESGLEAIKEYLQVKSVWIATESSVASPFASACSGEVDTGSPIRTCANKRIVEHPPIGGPTFVACGASALECGFFAQLLKICAARFIHEQGK